MAATAWTKEARRGDAGPGTWARKPCPFHGLKTTDSYDLFLRAWRAYSCHSLDQGGP